MASFDRANPSRDFENDPPVAAVGVVLKIPRGQDRSTDLAIYEFLTELPLWRQALLSAETIVIWLEERSSDAYLRLRKRAPMPKAKRARAVGFNYIALEVGDIDEALAFYTQILEFELRGKSADMAFIDLGDQFIALQKGRCQSSDDGRHFGLVVDDKEAVRRALAEANIVPLPGPFLDFRDPWGNRIEIVGYDSVQFFKAPNVLRGMGLTGLHPVPQTPS